MDESRGRELSKFSISICKRAEVERANVCIEQSIWKFETRIHNCSVIRTTSRFQIEVARDTSSDDFENSLRPGTVTATTTQRPGILIFLAGETEPPAPAEKRRLYGKSLDNGAEREREEFHVPFCWRARAKKQRREVAVLRME